MATTTKTQIVGSGAYTPKFAMANKRFIPPKQETWQNCGGDAYRLAIVAYM